MIFASLLLSPAATLHPPPRYAEGEPASYKIKVTTITSAIQAQIGSLFLTFSYEKVIPFSDSQALTLAAKLSTMAKQ